MGRTTVQDIQGHVHRTTGQDYVGPVRPVSIRALIVTRNTQARCSLLDSTNGLAARSGWGGRLPSTAARNSPVSGPNFDVANQKQTNRWRRVRG
jgi:hypothetical protein